MTQYLRAVNAKVGDELVFTRDDNASFKLDLARASRATPLVNEEGILVLSGGWTIIKTR